MRASVLLLTLLTIACHGGGARDRSRGNAPAGDVTPLSCASMQSCTDGCAAGDAACTAACAHRLTATARPFYDRLAACVAPACAAADAGSSPCRAAGSLACKMCVLAHCASLASDCIAH